MSIDDILYIYSINLYVYIVYVLNLIECMFNVLNFVVFVVIGVVKFYEKL